MPSWQVDRSRYMDGFVCPWRRLLRYHANLDPQVTASPLVTGIATHRSLELLLQPYLPGAHRGLQGASTAAYIALQEQPPSVWESASDPTLQQDLVTGLTHGYARSLLPWLLDSFDILALEQEQTLLLDHPSMPIEWMTRPDMICRHKQTGVLSIHDFKTTSYWADKNLQEWADNVQMMMNAHVCSKILGEPVPHYYVHFLIKGNEEYPTPLVSAWYQDAMPPFQKEDWQVKKPYGKSLKYRRLLVSTVRPLADWVWSLPIETVDKCFVLGGPFPVHSFKVEQFIAGLHANEWWWQQSIASLPNGIHGDLNDRSTLDATFPRTFNCYTYGSRCPYYRACFEPNWQPHYRPRVPHHTTETPKETP